MAWSRAAPCSLAVAVALASPAGAQIVGRPLELSGGAGLFSPDARVRAKSSPAYKGALGWRVLPGFVLEGQATFGPSEADTAPNQAHNLTMAGLDLRWDLRPADSKAVPFLLAGAGYGLSHTTGRKPEKLERGAASLGLGLLWNVYDPRCYLRLEARDILFREREQHEFSHDFAATAGLQWTLFGRPRDQDLDKVRDWLDRCPDTPIGAAVDAHGCPNDPDGDGVLDGIDKCADTPRGCTVDKNGCPSDADGDGVCDGVDVCPNTPSGLKVDARGCPIEVSEKEIELLDTGMIRLENIQFDVRKAVLKPQSFPALDEAGRVLQQYPQLRVEIGGHTDNRGSQALNDTLSASRANAVLEYLKEKFPAIPATQYTAKGYGFSRPIAPNTTELGRARNRRVEFKVLNTQALRTEREKRRFLKKEEPAAPDTMRTVKPAAPDTTRTVKPAVPDTIRTVKPDTTRAAPPDTTRH